MTATLVSLNPNAIVASEISQSVYLKSDWTDDWGDPVDDIQATNMAWRVAPGIPQCTLRWRYGRAMRPGRPTVSRVSALLATARNFVKVETTVYTVNGKTGNLVWVGIIENERRTLGGVNPKVGDEPVFPTGVQTFTAYGLELLLHRHLIETSVWLDSDSGESKTVARPITFNENGKGNRSALSTVNSYLFTDDVTPTGADFWSTDNIVRYLVAEQVPKTIGGSTAVPFVLEDNSVLADWDKPEVSQYGRTTYSLLNSLIGPRNLTGWYLQLSGGLTSEQMLIRTYTLTGSPITVSGGKSIPSNDSQIRIDMERDTSAQVSFEASTLERVDQVRYVGARRRSCCTLGIRDANINTGWPSALQDEYEDGGSGRADYATANAKEQDRMNADARGQEKFWPVFSRFVVPDAWDLKSHDGSGDASASAFKPVFPDDTTAANAYPIYRRGLTILPTLPLLDGHDYSTDVTAPTKTSVGPHFELPPQVFVYLPSTDPEEFVTVDKVAIEDGEDADGNNRAWSGYVHTLPDERAVVVRINGAEQHVWASADFVPLEEDENLGLFDFRDCRWTVAFEDDRHCVGEWPATADLTTDPQKEVRRHVIYVGDAYRQDYVAPNTVVGVDPSTGVLQVTTDGGVVRNDSPVLRDKAKAAFAYFGETRRAFSFSTLMVNSAINLGDYVEDFGEEVQHTANSVVTAIALDFPVAIDSQPQRPRLSYQTEYASISQVRL